ncbi:MULTISPECIES: SRPBCC family protein [unclassified Arthrobacter]|uniref:SRPBCC family protein n=1 Tax=unclassified Arthrobacter TaxID=235627 RepID=UPI00159D0819|nr:MULTISPECIES: SRPBCC family protein [unclassified Arthrobacter]MCQ9165523.1 SRPBCC family protein [Arthrobacter sp. STN4]NVM99837.1 SRPBCC family protein [Arthrobacter sp. SDTb3-6]
MELKHHFSVPSPLADTWHSFNQLEEIAPCFPGATLTAVEGDTFTGTVKVKLGPIAMLYAGTGEFTTRDEATHTVVIEAQGKDKRGNGTAGATVTAVLAADGDGTTVDVTTDMNITGKPAQFGRGVIQDISDKLLGQFVQCVIGKVGQPAAEEATPAAPPAAGATAAGGTAAEPPAAGAQDAGSAPVGQGAAPPARSEGRPQAAPVQAAAELNLGSAMWPVLAKRFAPAVLAVLGAIALGLCMRRRKRGRRK